LTSAWEREDARAGRLLASQLWSFSWGHDGATVVFAGVRQFRLIATEFADDASDLLGISSSGPFVGPEIAGANGTGNKPITRVDACFLQRHFQLERGERDRLFADGRKRPE
jgi:hypothetical protein